MFWTIAWFICNSLFVAAVIAYLFILRSYSEAKRLSADAAFVARLNGRRKLAGAIGILLFAAMVASFVINMRVNG
ncbi:hypothetical protein [Paenibacillus arenilitoris]|uniref:Uncharacterized protein n=1 Tax=Paenibacillus arenilitoris TaxID=2772299 RepID=A0A927CMG0_9BACL|nr:hypothetical protein [Paenibacillus arenilitoris]MBD2869527.1 hypothetical protein [Paenibacillus arenilitoris]